ncbi:MAG TPA: hypothetical protein VK395_18180 [Gemmataceae bacterium]|nr:hypothetical protein [Gemmataceae bacterium]
MSPETHDPELAALAKALTSLAPSPGKIDRDQVLFRAGQASTARRGRFWLGASGGVAVLGMVLGTTAFLRPAPQETERIVYLRPEPSPAPAPPEAEQSTSLAEADALPPANGDPRTEQFTCRNLEQLVLRWGVDALPASSSSPVPERSGDPEPSSPRTLRDYSDLLQADTTSSR